VFPRGDAISEFYGRQQFSRVKNHECELIFTNLKDRRHKYPLSGIRRNKKDPPEADHKSSIFNLQFLSGFALDLGIQLFSEPVRKQVNAHHQQN
jgi:hypothetical protein